MYRISRLMLLFAVMVYAYCLAAFALFCFCEKPAVGWLLLILGFLALAAQRKKIALALSAHGTASWAEEEHLRRARMIDARRGLILGRLHGTAKVGLMAGTKALVDGKLNDKDACQRFITALRPQKQPALLVRLPQAITSVCFAPPGAGKSTGLVIPFLLTCEESCVVIDFSGELALATAEARRRMGHEIVILDPYKVVTS